MNQILDELYTSQLGDESVVLEFVFANDLDAIDSAAVHVAPINGNDPAAGAMLVGSPQVSGTSVLQRVKPGINAINYALTCRAVHGADARVLRAVLPVRAA